MKPLPKDEPADLVLQSLVRELAAHAAVRSVFCFCGNSSADTFFFLGLGLSVSGMSDVLGPNIPGLEKVVWYEEGMSRCELYIDCSGASQGRYEPGFRAKGVRVILSQSDTQWAFYRQKRRVGDWRQYELAAG